MRQIFAIKYKRTLSVFTVVALILQSLLPISYFGTSSALAAMQTYTFATPGNYSTDSTTVIAGDDDVAMFNLTWNADDGDGLPTSDSILNMIYDPTSNPGTVLATTTGGSLERSAGDYGASFTTVTPASWNAVDMVITGGDIDFVAVGNGVSNKIYRSTDDGANWIASFTSFTESFTSVTYDVNNDYTWAGATDGTVWRSTDYGDNWTSQGASGLDSITDLLWYSGNTVIASGLRSSVSAVAYSTDSGATWALGSLPGSPPTSLDNTKMSMNYTTLYFGHNGYVATFSFDGQTADDMATSSNWTDISSNISGDIGTFTTVGGFISSTSVPSEIGIMFISLYDYDASQPRIVSTLDDGTDWIEHAPSDGFTSPAELIRMGNGRILWGVTDSSGNAETLISEHYGAGDSAITLTGISVATISSVDVTYHSKSETDEITMALGMSTGETDTWYFYDTSSWVGSTTDSYLKASGEVEMDANLGSFATDVTITGDVYLKIYQHEIDSPVTIPNFSYAFSIIDSITITYSSNGGGDEGGGIDTDPPSSWVNPLPEYSPESFTVTVTATDSQSNIAEVSLWYSIDRVPGPFVGDVTLAGTQTSGSNGLYSFEFTAPQSGTYYFVSSAIDDKGNDNAPEKPINLQPWPGTPPPDPEIEATTEVDATQPYIVKNGQTPTWNETDVSINGIVDIHFNEEINTTSFQLALYDGLNDDPDNDRSDLLGTPIWKKFKGISNASVEIAYNNLNELSRYTLKIITAKDLVGNNINPGYEPPDEEPLYAKWSFQTAPPQDPDITQSQIVVLNEPESGSFEVGNKVKYRVIIYNDGFLTAKKAEANLDFAVGLTYDSYAHASSGNLRLMPPGSGEKTGWKWDGFIDSKETIFIDFDVTIDNPAQELSIVQSVTMSDGINPAITREVVIFIAEDTNFSISSSKIVDKTQASVNELLLYTVTVVNSGPTIGYVEVNDPIPTGTIYKEAGSLTETGWNTLEYSSDTNSITGIINMLPVDVPISFTFYVRITASGTITNTATIQGSADDVNPNFPVEVAAITIVGGSPPEGSPQLISQSPEDGDLAVPLKAPIVILFNKQMLTIPSSFSYTVSRLWGGDPNIINWNVIWSDGDKKVTITPNEDWKIDDDYTIEVLTAQDTSGNQFVLGNSVANPWTFTTVYPTVKIIVPTFDPTMLVNTTKTYNPDTGQYEDMPYFVGLYDARTEEPYFVESGFIDIGFDMDNESGGSIGLTPNFTHTVDHVTIPFGESQTSFYYRDTIVSYPLFTEVTPFEDPSAGWADVTKNIRITDNTSPPSEPHFTINTSSQTIQANQMSGPIIIGAQAGTEMTGLPEYIFLHTPSVGGIFFEDDGNGQLVQLPEWVTVQDNTSTGNPQYYRTTGRENFVTFYYRDSLPGSHVLTISDNAILTTPDSGYNDVSFVMSVVSVVIEEIVLGDDLEDLIDDTGRIITTVEITPVETYILPNGVQTFEAKGFDQEGKVIKELKFKWYVLAGGGAVQKDGIGGDNHKTAFVAGEQPGVYYDTVMVATLYNGKIGYATANVYVVDITAIGGPTALPATGMSGLQLIFILLTLSAAVALAWVESYEKQHFSENKK